MRRTAAASAILLAGITPPLGSVALAASPVYVMPQETRLVKFRYHPDSTFEVFSRPNAITDIALGAGEKLVALALGDTVQWITADTEGHVFVKPLRPGQYTTATLVTSKRTYQISLRSVPENGNWYQRVSWEDDESNVIVRTAQAEKENHTLTPAYQPAAMVGTGNLDQMHFAYRIEGDAPFKPVQVMDDGRATWFQMPVQIQELPALFTRSGGNLALVNYTVHGRYMKAEQILNEAVLKLADDEVFVTRNGN